MFPVMTFLIVNSVPMMLGLMSTMSCEVALEILRDSHLSLVRVYICDCGPECDIFCEALYK